jgi:hypothetical protein
MKAFEPSRADGRSDKRVIYELAAEADPETVFDYAKIVAALEEGLPVDVDRPRVYKAIGAANKLLLREKRRYLSVVRNTGYKVIRADEHLPVALGKKDMAQTYLEKGIALLRHARLNELTEAQRTLHEGQLLVLSGLHQNMQQMARENARRDKHIDELRRRVERLEGTPDGEPEGDSLEEDQS